MLEEVVGDGARALLAQLGDSPLLGFLDGVGLAPRDEKLCVSAGGIVEDELASGIFGSRQGLEHIHLLQVDRRGATALFADSCVCCWAAGHD